MTGLIGPGARLIDAGTGETAQGARLASLVGEAAAAAERLPPGPVFAVTGPGLAGVVRLLGAWQAGRAVLPLDPAAPPPALADLVTTFRPAAVIGPAGPSGLAGYQPGTVPPFGGCLIRQDPATAGAHPDLGLLLATSGSTGRPKLVRLSRQAVLANAAAIGQALHIEPDSVAVTALPLFYSYGLTVLTSHLMAGATVVLTGGDVTGQPFWQAVRDHGVTTLALVPSQYEMLARLRWRPDSRDRLRAMTVSGGRLRDPLALRFHEDLAGRGGGLYVMYGQTEAGSRIAILPPARLTEKLGSAGVAIPGVRLGIRLAGGGETAEPGRAGEVVCHGPSIMMGYARSAAELAGPDLLGGTLHTGDLGQLDGDGYVWLSGRVNRIGKIFGVRVDLDSVEHLLAGEGPAAAVASGDTIRVLMEGGPGGKMTEGKRRELERWLAGELRVHRSGVQLRVVGQLPRLPNGKTDYQAAERLP